MGMTNTKQVGERAFQFSAADLVVLKSALRDQSERFVEMNYLDETAEEACKRTLNLIDVFEKMTRSFPAE